MSERSTIEERERDRERDRGETETERERQTERWRRARGLLSSPPPLFSSPPPLLSSQYVERALLRRLLHRHNVFLLLELGSSRRLGEPVKQSPKERALYVGVEIANSSLSHGVKSKHFSRTVFIHIGICCWGIFPPPLLSSPPPLLSSPPPLLSSPPPLLSCCVSYEMWFGRS